MTKEELEVAKLEAEIEKTRAEALESHRRRVWAGFADAVRITSGTIVLAIGLWAAVKTYEVIELKTEIAQKAKTQAEIERAAAFQARDDANVIRTRAETARRAAERDLQAVRVQIDAARVAIVKLQTLKHTSTASAILARVDDSINAASERALRPIAMLVPVTIEQYGRSIQIADDLNSEGFAVTVFRPLRDSGLAPAITEVRFFRQEDQEQASQISSTLMKAGIPSRIIHVADLDVRRPKTYEVRFATDPMRKIPPA